MIKHSIRFARPLWLGAALLVGSTAAHAQSPEPLGFEQALRLAQARSRQLPAQDAAAAAARDMAIAAGQLPDPTLKLGINNLPVSRTDRFSLVRDSMTMRSVGLMQEFTRADKRQARAARYEREAEVAGAGRTAALAVLQRETAMAWLDRYHQERMRELLRTARDEAGLQIEAADATYRGGRGSQADVFAARSAVAQIDDRLTQAERQVASAVTRLARWTGDTVARPLGPPPDIEAAPLDPDHLDDLLARHPDLALLARQEDVARADADVARSNRKADWSAELMYSQRGPGYANMLSINLSIPLQWDQKNRQDRHLAARLLLADQLHDQREEVTRERTADVRSMWLEWGSGCERLARYDRTLIPLAQERTRAALAAYRGGAAPLSAVLDARRGEVDSRMDRLRLSMDTARVWAQLNYLVPAMAGTQPPALPEAQP